MPALPVVQRINEVTASAHRVAAATAARTGSRAATGLREAIQAFCLDPAVEP